MTGGLAARVALLAVAVAGALWLADGLRAVTLIERGTANVEAGGRPPDAETAREALSLFRRASRRNPDPTARLEEASLLLTLGRERPAAALLEDITRSNPGSIRAWGLLSRATASFDDRRSTKANAERLRLYGRAQAPLYAGTLQVPGGVRYTVARRAVQGRVDSARVSGSNAFFKGWAARVGERRPAEAIIVVSRGRIVQTAVPSRARADLVPNYGAALRRSGFAVGVPLRRLRDSDGDIDIHVFGAGSGWASRLAFNCANTSRLRSC